MVDEDSGYAKDMRTGEIFPANNGMMLDKGGGGTHYQSQQPTPPPQPVPAQSAPQATNNPTRNSSVAQSPGPINTGQATKIGAAITRDPKNASLYIALADEMINNKEIPQKIIDVFMRAVAQKPLNGTREEISRIYRSLAKYNYTENNLRVAGLYYRKLVDINPTDTDAKFMLDYCLKNQAR